MNFPLQSRLTTALVTGVLLATLALSSGCFALLVGAGAGATVAYVRGDLDVTLDASLAQSARAVKKAVAQLGYTAISDKEDALQANFISRNSADQKLEIYLEKATADATKLKIRIGTFGNEALQNEILSKIKSNL